MILTLPFMLIAVNTALQGVNTSLTDVKDKCGLDPATSHEINLYLKSKRNTTGKWQTSFAVHTDATNKPLDDGMVLNLKQSVIKCGDKEFLQVQGVLAQDTEDGVEEEELLYFQKGGENTEFSNGRRTVRRTTGESDSNKGWAITNRPLKDGELFEMRIDEFITKWGNHLMVGVTTLTPAEIKFPDHILLIKSGTLVYHYENIYHNGTNVQSNYGIKLYQLKFIIMRTLVYHYENIYRNGTNVQSNYGIKLYQLKVGDRIGVARYEGGEVHFFVNGADQGAVKTKITGTIHGLIDVHHGTTQATIVNPK